MEKRTSGRNVANEEPTKRTPSHLTEESKQYVHQLIAERAYRLYEERGRTPGQALEHWLTAEREIFGS